MFLTCPPSRVALLLTLSIVMHSPSRLDPSWFYTTLFRIYFVFLKRQAFVSLCDWHILFPFSGKHHLQLSPLEKKNSSNVTYSMKSCSTLTGRFKQMGSALVIFVFLELIIVSSIVLPLSKNRVFKRLLQNHD